MIPCFAIGPSPYPTVSRGYPRATPLFDGSWSAAGHNVRFTNKIIPVDRTFSQILNRSVQEARDNDRRRHGAGIC
ncbi:hypothetical protein JCM19992_09530 [Thermostilla marina]